MGATVERIQKYLYVQKSKDRGVEPEVLLNLAIEMDEVNKRLDYVLYEDARHDRATVAERALLNALTDLVDERISDFRADLTSH